MFLQGEKVFLRALEPTDVDTLYRWENNVGIWEVSNTQTPYSRQVLEQYVSTAYQDIYTTRQLRLMICKHTASSASNVKNLLLSETVGCIDLFDFEPNHQRAGIGVLIADENDRGKQYASEALQLLINYCFDTLHLNQLFCNITTDNNASIALFQKHNFEVVGTKKQWVRSGSVFKDELLLQLIKK